MDWRSGISHEDRKNHEDRKKIALRALRSFASLRCVLSLHPSILNAKNRKARKAEDFPFSIFQLSLVICSRGLLVSQ
jgi:hypothetical protein